MCSPYFLFQSSNWVTGVNASYRQSRAGRVVPGSCYRLFSRARFATFADVIIPEIQKDPLEELCLHAKVIAAPNVSISEYLSKVGWDNLVVVVVVVVVAIVVV